MPGEAAGGPDQVQPLVPGAGPLPVRQPFLRLAEGPRLPYHLGRPRASGPVGVDGGPGPEAAGRRVRQHPAEDLGERRAQVLRRVEGVPEHRQPAAGAQHRGGLRHARDRVHPVPGLRGDDRVERAADRVPVLELRDLRLGPALPGQLGHPRVGINAEPPAAGRLEQPGGDAGAAPDVEDVASRAGGDDAVHQAGGIGGPGPVVAAGVGTEPLGDLPLEMRCLRPVVAPGAGLSGSLRF